MDDTYVVRLTGTARSADIEVDVEDVEMHADAAGPNGGNLVIVVLDQAEVLRKIADSLAVA